MILDEAGWLTNTRQLRSPNYNQRPANTAIDLLVIHHISVPANQFGGPWIDRLFTNQLPADGHESFGLLVDLRVSAHLLINRQGQITQYVGLNQRAWHAGQSAFQGRSCCNDYSIGIELEGSGDVAFTHGQYQQLIAVTKVICDHYPQITPERIVGHSDIAPGRKFDPGPKFDWGRYQQGLSATP